MFWRKRKQKPDVIYDGKWLEPSNPELAKQEYPELGEVCEIELFYTKIGISDTIRVLFNPPLIHYNGFDSRSEFETLALCTGIVRRLENTNDDDGIVSQKTAIEITEVFPASDFPSLIANNYNDNWFQRHGAGAGLTYVVQDDNWIYLSCDIQSNSGFEMVLIRERERERFNVIYSQEYCVGTPNFVSIGSRKLAGDVSKKLADRIDEMGAANHWHGKKL